IVFGALLKTHNVGTGMRGTTMFSSRIALAAQPATQTCPQKVNSPAYWNNQVGVHLGASHIEHILCKRLQGNTTQQALITVRNNGDAALLDAYVYTHISDHHPELLFSAKELL